MRIKAKMALFSEYGHLAFQTDWHEEEENKNSLKDFGMG